MWVLTILVAAVIGLVAKWVMDRRSLQRTIERLGLPGPKPDFLMGNIQHIFDMQKKGKRGLMEFTKTYGKTFGYYEGWLPVIATSDTEIIKHVLIKNFSSFHSRKVSLFSPSADSITTAKGEHWKRLRMIVSPTFSARGMKEMSPLVNKCVDGLLKVLDKREKEGKPFDIMKDYQSLTMSAIGICGFGLDLNTFEEEDNIFLTKCREVFSNFGGSSAGAIFRNIVVPLNFICPTALKALKYLSHDTFALPRQWFFDTAASIIEQRKTQKVARRDFIQLMLEAEHHDQPGELDQLEVAVDGDTTDTTDTSHKPTNTSHKPTDTSQHVKTSPKASNIGRGKGMTLSEMQSQCMVFLLAGYETTSTALSFATYELATHPEIQAKLQQEIDELFPEDKMPDYLSVQSMPYLDRVFNETLRLHTLAQIVNNRECFEDLTIGDLHIPKGTVVQIHVEAVHMDPEHWGPEDPSEFVPDRFLPERKAARSSVAWLPFGAGPRNCVGMRFALMEAKITLTRILRAYNLVKPDQLKIPLPVTTSGVIRPSEGVVIRLERR